MSSEMVQVVFQPSGRRGKLRRGLSVVEAARLLGEDIEAPCGEKQICGKCKVRILEGSFKRFGIDSKPEHAGPWTESEDRHLGEEQRAAGFRLGCVARLEGDLVIDVPESSRAGKPVVSKAVRALPLDLNPAVKPYCIALLPPALGDAAGDFDGVAKVLQEQQGIIDAAIDIHALRDLPAVMRRSDGEITVDVWMEREIVRVRPGRQRASYGLAVDIGTTTVAGYLCDLASGEVVETVSMMNPQVKYGEDVLSRISYQMEHADGLQRMSADIVSGINRLIEQSLDAHNQKARDHTPLLAPDDIIDVAIVGNTTMHHIFLQLDPRSLGAVPFSPVVRHSLDLKARDLGLRVNPAAHVFMFPNEAGFVGGDNVGVILAEQPHRSERMQLIIDIGTNGELVLGNRHRLLCSSCATGPALEGAHIEFGMRAAPGAIERVQVDPTTWEVDYKVVGREAWRRYSQPEDMQTKGICGSGILDVLAEFYLAGVITKTGAFNLKQSRSKRLRDNPASNQAEFVLAWAEETSIGRDVVITQRDIREIQLAKAAIYCGCKLMMRKLGVTQIDEIKIAGSFGTHVNRRLALVMGMIPDCPVEAVRAVGNAAGDGCRLALLDRNKRTEADEICRRIDYLELTLEPDFQDQLVAAIHIPHMNDPFPHLAEQQPAGAARYP